MWAVAPLSAILAAPPPPLAPLGAIGTAPPPPLAPITAIAAVPRAEAAPIALPRPFAAQEVPAILKRCVN